MKRMLKIALLLALSVAPVLQARAQETASVPAWTPQLGKVQSWKVDLESGEKTLGGVNALAFHATGTLVQHMTPLARTPEGFSVLWEFDIPSEGPALNNLYRGTLGAFGVLRLAIGVDAAGMPFRTYGVEALHANVQKRIAEVEPQAREEASMLTYMLEVARDNPLFEIQSLASAAILQGRLQRSEIWTARVGDTFRKAQLDHMYGAPVRGEADMRVEAIDQAGRNVTLSWTWDVPLAQFPETIQAALKRQLAENAVQGEVLPGALRTQAADMAHRFSGRARISLEDGAVLDAEETRSMRVGLVENLVIIRMSRHEAVASASPPAPAQQ